MKVFIYSKKTSKKIATLTDIIEVRCNGEKNEIMFTNEDSECFAFDTTQVKTTSYQN